MKYFYEYIKEASREKQARLMEVWLERPVRSYRWQNLVQEALKSTEK